MTCIYQIDKRGLEMGKNDHLKKQNDSNESSEKKKTKKNHNQEKQKEDHTDKKKKKVPFFQWLISLTNHALVAALLSAAIIYIINALFSFHDMKNEIESINDSLKTLNSSIVTNEKFSNLQTAVNSLQKDVDTVSDQMLIAEGAMTAIRHYTVEDSFIQYTNCFQNEQDSGSWDDATIVGVAKNGEWVVSKELQNKKVLLTYTDDGHENIFFGQYNKNNHWDGECLINSYIKGKLEYITNAVYDDGKLIRYEQAYKRKDTSEWMISHRKHENGINTGESWSYYDKTDYPMTFDPASVVVMDLIGVSQFENRLTGGLSSYYCGDTKGGAYNDDSGNAYLITYDTEGNITMLYEGRFSDGKLEDSKGDAWYIRWSNPGYIYYKGTFSENRRDNDINIERNITTERLTDLTLDKNYNRPLIWHEVK